jgi:hypothetical protein
MIYITAPHSSSNSIFKVIQINYCLAKNELVLLNFYLIDINFLCRSFFKILTGNLIVYTLKNKITGLFLLKLYFEIIIRFFSNTILFLSIKFWHYNINIFFYNLFFKNAITLLKIFIYTIYIVIYF